mgnify:CR=1 FL=1
MTGRGGEVFHILRMEVNLSLFAWIVFVKKELSKNMSKSCVFFNKLFFDYAGRRDAEEKLAIKNIDADDSDVDLKSDSDER